VVFVDPLGLFLGLPGLIGVIIGGGVIGGLMGKEAAKNKPSGGSGASGGKPSGSGGGGKGSGNGSPPKNVNNIPGTGRGLDAGLPSLDDPFSSYDDIPSDYEIGAYLYEVALSFFESLADLGDFLWDIGVELEDFMDDLGDVDFAIVSGIAVNNSISDDAWITILLPFLSNEEKEMVSILLATKKTAKRSDKEQATDIPSWAKPRPGESGKDFADRMMDSKYGRGGWRRSGTQGREHSQLKKWGDRGQIR
jgi:hypothetical protein